MDNVQCIFYFVVMKPSISLNKGKGHPVILCRTLLPNIIEFFLKFILLAKHITFFKPSILLLRKSCDPQLFSNKLL